MSEKEQEPRPLVANGHKEELGSVTAESREQTKKKRMKCVAFAMAFTIFQIGVIFVFVFVVLRFKNPKFRIRSGSFHNDTFQIGRDKASPYFNLTLETQFGVKNTNFGHFKYEMCNVTFAYRGTVVGFVSINRARARARSTRKFDAMVVLKTESDLPNTSELSDDISSGKVPLTSSSELNGKIQFMKLIKKKKSAQMNCTMNLDIHTRTLQDILCK